MELPSFDVRVIPLRIVRLPGALEQYKITVKPRVAGVSGFKEVTFVGAGTMWKTSLGKDAGPIETELLTLAYQELTRKQEVVRKRPYLFVVPTR